MPIKKYINEVNRKKKFKLDDQSLKELTDVFPHNVNFNEEKQRLYINKNVLRNLLQISTKKNFEKIYNIFGEKGDNKEDIVTFESLEYLYYAFTDNNPKVKFILFSFLIFENNESIEEKEINTIIKDLFKKVENMHISFMQYTLKVKDICINNYKKKKSNKNADNKVQIMRHDFIKNMNLFEGGVQAFDNYKFIKEFKALSEFKLDNKNKDNLNFYCDCSKNRTSEKSKSYSPDDLNSIRNEFDIMTSGSNHVLPLFKLRKIMDEKKIERNFIKLITNYLQKITLKEYCCFEDLKNLFLNLKYTLALDEKKKFLFKMISFINKNEEKISFGEIAKYLKIVKKEKKKEENNDENKNEIKEENKNEIIEENNIMENNDANDELFDEESFMKNERIENLVKNMNPSIEKFGLLPYLDFRLKTDDKKIRKRLINDLLKDNNFVNHEKFLESQFEDCDYFYPINIDFWNILIDPNKDAPDYINNSNIAEEIVIEKEEDRYRKIENERIKKIFEEEKKKKEEKEKKKNKNTNNNASKQAEENNKKEKDKEKENNKEQNKIEEIITKNARLKKGVKYNKDFIIICGQLFNFLKNNYKFDYIIKIKKMQEIIDISKNNKNEEKKENEKPKEKEKEENKNNQEQEKKDEEKEKEKKEEEEYLNKKENFVKEKLDKFIIDDEKGFITKITRYDSDPKNKENEGKYILNELDFYPVQVYTKTFGVLVREIEKAKIKYDELEKQRQYNLLSDKEKKKIIDQKNRENQLLHDKVEKYGELKVKLENKVLNHVMSHEEYKLKIKALQEQYKEIFQEKEKTIYDYEVDIGMSEFIDTLAVYKDEILCDNSKNIFLRQRYKTFKDIKRKILKDNYKILNDKTYKIYYYYFSTKTLFIPDDDFCFENEGKAYEPFVCIIVDIYNDKGENFYDLLGKKEKDKEKNKPKSDNNNEIEKMKEKNRLEQIEEIKRPLTDEEKKNIKERQKKEKLEREKLEKERKEKEKEEKLRRKKEREEYERQEREREKEFEKKIKELKRKEKEEQQKQKALQKERERELQRQKERENFIHPPYGIDNFGNTCYFNSVNQIFLNLPILQQIFLDKRIDFFINKNNKFGQQGKFLEIFKALYWIKKSKIGDTALNLKKMVGKIKEDFNNSQQQDANEYLNFLIDTLHEEINMHASKIYIEERDEVFNNNTIDEVGNIYWSNGLRRNASFIDSIFMFQLKSNLKCKKCNTVKYNFENNYMFNLPLSLCKMVTVEIYLYKLPFIYKLYYSEINPKFKEYISNPQNSKLTITQNLWNFYSSELTIEEKKNQSLILHFSFDLEREKKMTDIINIIRGIKILELEQEKREKIDENEEIKLYNIEHYTELITYSKEKNRIIYPDQELDKYVNIEDKIIINVYEVLNSKGIKLIYQDNSINKKSMTLYSLIPLKDKLKSIDDIKNKLSKQKQKENEGETPLRKKEEDIKIISLRVKMTYLKDQEIDSIVSKASPDYKFEFALPIFHYKISKKKSNYLFNKFFHIKIKDFPVQYIILNDDYSLSAKNLYNYIWNLNKAYLNHPNLDPSQFWWNKIAQNENISLTENKLCYPFVLRYYEILDEKDKDYYQELIHCPLCPWFSFCPGCIIDPRSDLKKLSSNFGIVVDWCQNFIEDELNSANFQIIKEIDSQIISENLPINDKEQNYQSINDCFKLFFDEENLEDPLYCHHCHGPENFSKKYSINRLPYVLILSLKRFKFNKNSNFKLRQMITYPLYDLDLEGKKYDLYGVINHYGSINSGHYTAIVKNKEKEWILCNDSSVYKIEEKRVMHSNAYILFYISKESPYSFDYIKMMKSLMNNIKLNDKKNKKNVIDNNFFRYEPVEVKIKTKYNIGYVMEEKLIDYNVDENYDIYNDLEKEDKIRIDNLIKRDGDEAANNKTKTNEKDSNKENNKENNDNKKNTEKENNKEETNKKDENKEQKEVKPTEPKKEEVKDENKKEEEKKEDKIEEHKDKNEINTSEEKKSDDKNEIIIENKNENENELENKKEEKIEKKEKEVLPDYYKDIIRVKLEFCDGWIHKSHIKKIVSFEEKEKEKEKNKK